MSWWTKQGEVSEKERTNEVRTGNVNGGHVGKVNTGRQFRQNSVARVAYSSMDQSFSSRLAVSSYESARVAMDGDRAYHLGLDLPVA